MLTCAVYSLLCASCLFSRFSSLFLLSLFHSAPLHVVEPGSGKACTPPAWTYPLIRTLHLSAVAIFAWSDGVECLGILVVQLLHITYLHDAISCYATLQRLCFNLALTMSARWQNSCRASAVIVLSKPAQRCPILSTRSALCGEWNGMAQLWDRMLSNQV